MRAELQKAIRVADLALLPAIASDGNRTALRAALRDAGLAPTNALVAEVMAARRERGNYRVSESWPSGFVTEDQAQP